MKFTMLPVEPKEQEEIKYDNPDGCEAIVAVAEDGSYLFLRKPNLWFFECEPAPQDNGFGDYFEMDAGVYRMRFGYREWKHYESGYVDDWSFDLESAELLYKV